MEYEIFKDVLNEGEVLQKALKPNKVVYVLTYTFGTMIGFFVLLVLFTIFFIIDSASAVYILIPTGIIFIATIIMLLFALVTYKNIYYAITNKRVIIRSGVLGIDFKSMDLNDIYAVETNVSLFDKVMGKKTGTILLGSPTRPIMAYTISSFSLQFVMKPYELSKEIKLLVNNAKANNETKQGNDNFYANSNFASSDNQDKQTANIKSDEILDKLEKLNKLREQGVVSEQEFIWLKSKIIDG